eukprot:gnl/TRDRNA2_/TRDRNA2_136448_c2_seq1.p1 gnl/TRDRNA2_/TRDRNA2_136448_c2~~gnl/TRDRNA2_/TRDRNA2_136448_c2_seq1.p1  ORF type:complete len:319 (+),score=58.56 gnl/TRDRNA2_/TRDRNA2_136448_c2_seq1:1-957(+)
MASGYPNATSPNEAVINPAVPFAREQAHRMAIVPLSSSRISLLYAGHIVDAQTGKLKHAFGGALLVQVKESAELQILGKYRFTAVPVARITATPISPTSFVIGYRGLPLEAVAGQPSQELSLVWCKMEGDELYLQPQPVLLEPKVAEMWARDVALVGNNMFAYTYQAGGQKALKMTIVKLDPNTHAMTITADAVVIEKGSTDFLHSIDLPYGDQTSHTFTFFQHPLKASAAKVCRISPEGTVKECNALNWASSPVSSAFAVRLWGGPSPRILFVFSDKYGIPFYQYLGIPPDEPPHESPPPVLPDPPAVSAPSPAPAD